MNDGSEFALDDSAPVERSFLSRNTFSLLVGLTVLVTAFAYGLAVGFSRNLGRAHAASNIWGAPPAAEYELHRIILPQGVKLVPVGDELALNGKTVEMAAFVSSRGVQDVLNEIVAGWERQGLNAVGASSRRRGIAFAVNPSTGERYSASAWIVPPAYRRIASNGLPVQGFMAVGVEEQELQASPDESAGLVPGVPLAPDGRTGAVLSSKDPHGRSHTGTYINPGDIARNMQFYRSQLRADGWREADFRRVDERLGKTGSMIMQREGKELVLLFSERPPSHTLVTIALSSQPVH